MNAYSKLAAIGAAVSNLEAIADIGRGAKASAADRELSSLLQAAIDKADTDLQYALDSMVRPIWPMLSRDVKAKCRSAGVDLGL